MPPVTIAAARSTFNFTTLLQSLPTSTSPLHASTKCSACMFSTSSSLSVKKPLKRRANDPYRAAQAKQRKNANIARQAVLQKERKEALGNPVRSTPTAFVQSFRDPLSYMSSSSNGPNATDGPRHLNFFLKSDDLAQQLERSKWLTEPLPTSNSHSLVDDRLAQQEAEAFKRTTQEYLDNHDNAERALRKITALSHGSSKDRTRLNIQRCIDEFGRHNTDNVLAHRPASAGSSSQPDQLALLLPGQQANIPESEAGALADLNALPARAGPDTGSSEVQIAILTAKINTLADNLGKKDMHNKRNLRLLVHRRQKLLNYLRRRERGGPRWQNLVEKLGISEAMWRGEITM